MSLRASGDDASPSVQPTQLQEMGEQPRPASADGSVAKMSPPSKGAWQGPKQNLDYALRSGLAGGLAGCAVSHTIHMMGAAIDMY
jgi:hypothetical protein